MATNSTTSAEKNTSDLSNLSNLNLEPAKVDYLSVKTQIIIAALLSSVLIFAIYWPTLKIGFLHDDFLHLDYVARAVMKGDAHDFLANLYSNWGGSDLMQSYRPLVSMSLLFDFLVFRTHAFGFHLTNLLLTCSCSLFVALIASELSGPFGNRMKATTAIWAALLFAAYPLHVESVAWIIGRVDLLCTLFYLAALYYFLRLRLIEEPVYIALSVGCFCLSLLSKEMAVTLPAVAMVFSLLVPSQADFLNSTRHEKLMLRIFRRPSRLEWQAIGLLWLVLVFFAMIRTLILGNPIGGYGNSGLSALLGSFANEAAMVKIIAPTNEEVLAHSKSLFSVAIFPYAAALVFAGLRCLTTPSLVRFFVAFALFGIIALLPTYQIWNIAPNLCGSRLFFLSSVALALTFAFAFIPNEDGIDRTSTKFISTIGTACLLFTLIFYTYLVRGNVSPYIEAGERMLTLRQQVEKLSQGEANKMLLLNLPSDFRGAPMLTRPQYFLTMMAAPFSKANVGNHVGTSEMELPADHTNYSVEKLNEGLSSSFKDNLNFWSDAEGQILPLHVSGGKDGFQCSFNDLNKCSLAPSQTKMVNGTIWHVFKSDVPQVEQLENAARLFPGQHGLTAKMPVDRVNPLTTALVKIKMKVSANQPVSQLLPIIKLSWGQEQNVITKIKTANLVQTGEGTFECPLINNKEWLLGGSVNQVGLSLLPASYYVTVQSIEGISRQESVPELVESVEKGKFLFKAGKVRDASSVLILVSKPDTTFDTAVNDFVLQNYRNLSVSPDRKQLLSENSFITGKALRWFCFEQPDGSFNLPKDVYNDGRNHQIVAISLDKNGATVGLPSRVLKVK